MSGRHLCQSPKLALRDVKTCIQRCLIVKQMFPSERRIITCTCIPEDLSYLEISCPSFLSAQFPTCSKKWAVLSFWHINWRERCTQPIDYFLIITGINVFEFLPCITYYPKWFTQIIAESSQPYTLGFIIISTLQTVKQKHRTEAYKVTYLPSLEPEIWSQVCVMPESCP